MVQGLKGFGAGRGGRVLVVNPPLLVPERFIDYPPFSFFQPAVYANLMAESGVDVRFFDCFAAGSVSREAGGRLLGGGSARGLLAAASGRTTALIHFSSFQRHAGLRAAAVAETAKLLSRAGLATALADFYDGSCHYVDYRSGDALRAYPGVLKIFRRDRAPFLESSLKDLFPQLKANMPARLDSHLRFLENCRRAGLLKDLHDAGPVFPYVASIGCPCKCVFCTNMIDKWTPLPVGSIEADWRRMRQAGVETVAVMDQFANFDPARFVRILEMAGDLGLKLHFTNGVGLGKIDARSAELLAKTTRLLYVSPESGCALTLRKLRKRFGIETAENALRLLSASGVKVHGHYIVGAPWEGRAAVNESLATVARWSEELGVEAHVQPFVPKRAFRVQGRRVQSVYGRFETFRDGWTEEAVLGLGLRNAAAGASKLIINAGYRCMNDCVFCSVADRPRKDGSFSAQARAMARLEASGVRLLDIDGGEPLLYPGIFELLDLAGCLGYERITLTTNGRALAAGRLLARLKRYGGLDLLISIHGPSAEVHDALTRSPGSFNETVAGMRNAVKAGLSPGMNVTLVRENAAVLPATAALAARLGARVLNIQYYTPFGNVDPALAPGSGSARRVREAVAAAKKAGLPVNLVNFPPCYARDLSPLMMGDFFKESRLMLFADGTLVNLARYLGDRRFKTGKCGACESSIICRGFWRNEGA